MCSNKELKQPTKNKNTSQEPLYRKFQVGSPWSTLCRGATHTRHPHASNHLHFSTMPLHLQGLFSSLTWVFLSSFSSPFHWPRLSSEAPEGTSGREVKPTVLLQFTSLQPPVSQSPYGGPAELRGSLGPSAGATTSPLAGALGEGSQTGTPEALRAAENQASHRMHKMKKKRASPL